MMDIDAIINNLNDYLLSYKIKSIVLTYCVVWGQLQRINVVFFFSVVKSKSIAEH